MTMTANTAMPLEDPAQSSSNTPHIIQHAKHVRMAHNSNMYVRRGLPIPSDANEQHMGVEYSRIPLSVLGDGLIFQAIV